MVSNTLIHDLVPWEKERVAQFFLDNCVECNSNGEIHVIAFGDSDDKVGAGDDEVPLFGCTSGAKHVFLDVVKVEALVSRRGFDKRDWGKIGWAFVDAVVLLVDAQSI